MTASLAQSLILPGHQEILAGISQPLLLVDHNSVIRFANDACEAFFGRSRNRIIDCNITQLLRFENDRMNQVLAAGEGDEISAQDMAVINPHATASADISISPLQNSPQWRVILVTPRIGRREHIGEHSEQGQLQAIGAPAILGHEIKNPLAGIKAAAQLLARQAGTSDTALTDLIVNEVDRIARLLDQMQNLGNSNPGILLPENIHLLIERAIRSMRAANRSMPNIEISYDPSLPDVLIDADAMVQILINLLQNAVDALSGNSDGSIEIRTRFVMGGALRETDNMVSDRKAVKLPVEITISDNGPGVPAHIENEIFSAFVTTKRDGQGLGLAIVRKLILQMNSRIQFERDTANQMTRFHLYLPVARTKDNQKVAVS